MSEWPHSHSDQSKARISLAMRKFWHKSLKLKRLQEKLYCSWARYIAEAAQRGVDDQREHDWDSYRKTNAELNFQYLQDREEKVKAREMTKLRAEQVAKERAEKLAQRTKMKEEKAKARTLSRQNLLNRKKKSALVKDLKLIRKLTKIQYRMKPEILATSRRASSVKSQPSIENLNLELIKPEKVQRSLALADKLETPKSKEKKLAQS